MKIKIVIIFLANLILAYGLFAQNNTREWSQGKLTWDDFKEGKSELHESQISYFAYSFLFFPERQMFENALVVRNVARAHMDRNLSWVNPEYKTEQLLRYNQVIFDIVELYRRKLQIELYSVCCESNITECTRFVCK